MRPRTTACIEEHFGPCKACARERARRYRESHPARIRQADQRRTTADRKQNVYARAYVDTALRKGCIAPPLRCDRCLEKSNRLTFRHPDPAQPKVVAWLCPGCVRHVRSCDTTVEIHWVWPGPRPPRRARRRPHFSEEAHARALGDQPLPVERPDRVRYVRAYLAEIGPRSNTWIAEGLTNGGAWAPTGHRDIDAVWQWAASEWWKQKRLQYDSEHRRPWTVATLAAVIHEPEQPTLPQPQPAPPPTPPITVKPLAQLESDLDRAIADFEAKVAAILSRKPL